MSAHARHPVITSGNTVVSVGLDDELDMVRGRGFRWTEFLSPAAKFDPSILYYPTDQNPVFYVNLDV
jgi:hypothetical protein